jgi:hypothetical protein
MASAFLGPVLLMPLLSKTLANVAAILAGLIAFAPEIYYETKARLEAESIRTVPIAADEVATQPRRLEETGARWVTIGMEAGWSSPPAEAISMMSAPRPAPENPMAMATEEDLKQYREDRRSRAQPRQQSDICRNSRVYFYRGNERRWYCRKAGQRQSSPRRAA